MIHSFFFGKILRDSIRALGKMRGGGGRMSYLILKGDKNEKTSFCILCGNRIVYRLSE